MKVSHGILQKSQKLNEDTFLIEIRILSFFEEYKPGNFVMVSLEKYLKPFLPRPFSIFDYEPKDNVLKLIVKDVGEGSHLLCYTTTPYSLTVWGPLGNAFPVFKEGKNVVVAGGIGVVPLFNLDRYIKIHKFFVGFKNKKETFLLEEIKKYSDVTISTDDGSFGEKGFITDHFEKFLEKEKDRNLNVYACGPEPFLKKVYEIGKAYGIKNLYASFETFMACGFGVCLGCTVETPSGYVKVCKDGTVFNVEEIYGNKYKD